jgi:hypothetical protein
MCNQIVAVYLFVAEGDDGIDFAGATALPAPCVNSKVLIRQHGCEERDFSF